MYSHPRTTSRQLPHTHPATFHSISPSVMVDLHYVQTWDTRIPPTSVLWSCQKTTIAQFGIIFTVLKVCVQIPKFSSIWGSPQHLMILGDIGGMDVCEWELVGGCVHMTARQALYFKYCCRRSINVWSVCVIIHMTYRNWYNWSDTSSK